MGCVNSKNSTSDGAELLSGGTMMSMRYENAAEKTLEDPNFMQKLFNNITQGSTSVVSTVTDKTVVATDFTTDETKRFFTGLKSIPSKRVSVPIQPLAEITEADGEQQAAGQDTDDEDDEGQHQSHANTPAVPQGRLYVDYLLFPVKNYVKLPAALKPFLNISKLKQYLLVSKPSMSKSAGLANHRAVVPKEVRKSCPMLIVIDEPGMLDKWKDTKYIWVEIPLLDVFMLDVSKMNSMDDYLTVLSRKARWNFKDRQRKFHNPKAIKMEYVPLDKAMIDTLWPLYQATGEKNGFTVLTKEEFYGFHQLVEGLYVMYIWDVRNAADKKLISFCTGVRTDDVLLPMWCGTDYDNELQRTCATYFNMLYEFVRIAVQDPEVNWVDLGATRRTAKTAIGFTGHKYSGYFRCRNTVVQTVIETFAKDYFKPEDLVTDP